MPEEDIYDILDKQYPDPPPCWGSGGQGDMLPMEPGDKVKAVNNVVKAIHQAKISGQPGSIPGDIEKIVKQFLAPVVPWETVLHQFFRDLLDEDYSWRRPNRRHDPSVLYLPSKITDDGRLEHLAYYWDVSGSISDKDEVRFNSEVKHIWDYYQPKKLTLVQFDTRITKIDVFNEGDTFEGVKIVGKGGTDLRPVREHIMEHRPTAAIIFSDLFVEPMQSLDRGIPIIWVVVNNPSATVPFGKLLHIKV
jgi:predicted metal-dependent peptidase